MNEALTVIRGMRISEIKGINKNGLDFSNYIVTKEGEVFNLHKNKFLTPFKTKHGYLRVTLWNKNKRQTYYVHQLVLQAFEPTSDDSLEVNHQDFNKKNNHISNLEWVTRSQNMIHYHEHKRQQQSLESEVIEA